jgi:hypothetical protein
MRQINPLAHELRVTPMLFIRVWFAAEWIGRETQMRTLRGYRPRAQAPAHR